MKRPAPFLCGIAWLAACARPAPPPAPEVVAIPPATTSLPAPAKPEPRPEALPPLRWTITEGGGAGFLPIGGEHAFMGVDRSAR